MTHNLIIPLAADKPEYDDCLPEWLDLHPEGNLMLYECVRGLPLSEFDRICPVILARHDRRFNACAAIDSQFEKEGLQDKVDIIRLDESTKSQPETVARAIEAAGISGSIFIKDGDNFFACSPVLGENCVATFPLDALKNVNPANKSYIMLDDSQYITNIIEKVIISRFFCAGGYGFADSLQFLSYYRRLAHYRGLYISHIIYAMLLDGHLFRPVNVKDYVDWGTREEWLKFKNQFVTLFVPLTSLLSASFGELFTEAQPHATNVEQLGKLYDGGKTKIIVLSEQDESSRTLIEERLKFARVRYHQLLFGVFPGGRMFQSHCEPPAGSN